MRTPPLSASAISISTSSSSAASASASASSLVVNSAYDWECEENVAKWRGIFMQSLEKVLRQVHPTLMAQEDALRNVDSDVLMDPNIY
jgi:hypothetical protein